MIFTRSAPYRNYRDYTKYCLHLRLDFQYRCAYCLTHEYHNGGEANFEIDHHRPLKGPRSRPDLAAVYSNLYWSCRECNSNKADAWPDEMEYDDGFRYIDPCEEWGDHDLNWVFHHDGTIEALTNAGIYTEDQLMLWREMLRDHREQIFHDQDEVVEIESILQQVYDYERRAELEKRLNSLMQYLYPPVYDRPRRKELASPSDGTAR